MSHLSIETVGVVGEGDNSVKITLSAQVKSESL